MDGSGLRDLVTAIGGAVVGALTAWAVVAAVTAGGSASDGDVARPDGRRTSGSAAVVQRWDVPESGWQRSVVQVRTERCDGAVSGTGVVVDGRVVTNVHVVEGAERVMVGTHDGRSIGVVAVAVSRSVDVAELTLDPSADRSLLGPGVSLAPTGPSLRNGERWTMAGFPAGTHYRTRSVTFSDVLRGGRFPDPVQAWHLDAAVAGGESGSPIVDGRGRLAGVLYARSVSDGDGLAVSVDDLRDARRGLVARPFDAC